MNASEAAGSIGPGRVRPLLAGATLVAAVATAGSLYFSEVMGLTPCDLCWYQRILMYPLVVVLGVATLEDRAAAWRTVLPLSVAGIGVSAYHSYIQIDPSVTCSVDGGCTAVLWRGLGVFTIPRLALLAFLLLTAAAAALALADRGGD